MLQFSLWSFLFFVHVTLYWLAAYAWRDNVGTLSHSQVIPLVLFNQVLSALWYPVLLVFPYVPPSWWIPIEIIEIAVIDSFIFGALHSLVHDYKPLKWIHNIHHQLVIPTGSGAFYAHPLEHIFIVIGSVVYTIYLCLFLLPVSYEAILLFTATASINTIYAHTAGTDHAYHHSHGGKNRSNVPPLWDILMGTLVHNPASSPTGT